MSYILEALKKAEHQREIGQVPSIGSEHEPALAGLSSRWVVIVVLVLLVNAGLLLALFWPNDAAEIPGQTASFSNRSNVAPLPEARRPENAAAEVSVQTRREEVPPARPAPAPVQAPVIAQRQWPAQAQPMAPASAARVSPPVPVPAVAAPPPVRLPEPAPVQSSRDLPVWPQVPASVLQRLPNGLRLDVHVFSEQPRDRFVLINLQKYREGEQLQEGPVLDEITAEGIVLSLQGRQFLVRAQ